MNNDVLLVPVTTVQPDLHTQTDVVVYVPLASKTAHGIVKIGDGLNIGANGNLSFDRSEITIKEISINGGEAVKPDVNKKVNLELDKTTVGLTNVDNTSDLDKPISNATQLELDKINTVLSGVNKAVSYETYQKMVSVLNVLGADKFVIGQSIYINTPDVPDLWVYAVDDTKSTYVYSTDDSLIEDIVTNGSVQIGYYKIAMLETLKTNLDNYVTLDSAQVLSGKKVFKEPIGLYNKENGSVEYLKYTNNSLLIGDSVEIDTKNKIFNFYGEPIALEKYVKNNYVSFTRVQALTEEQQEIARLNIGAGTGGGSGTGVSVKLIWWED